MDFVADRNAMVDQQLIARGIHDRRVLAAMRTVPREMFVPRELRAQAHTDQPLPIGGGQTISQPYIVAVLLEALRLRGGETVLEVGTGSGYSAAVLSHLVDNVVTIERDPELAESARRALRRYGVESVRVLTGDGTKGYPEGAPYDGIAVHALADKVPRPLLEQLAVGGRMVIPVAGKGADHLMTYVRTVDGFARRTMEAVQFVPLVPDDR